MQKLPEPEGSGSFGFPGTPENAGKKIWEIP